MSTLAGPITAGADRTLPRMSEQEYVDWAFKQPFESEWVDGEVIIMPPISGDHDETQTWLKALMLAYVQHHDLGSLRGDRFQVRLPKPSRREPDIIYIVKEHRHLLKDTY